MEINSSNYKGDYHLTITKLSHSDAVRIAQELGVEELIQLIPFNEFEGDLRGVLGDNEVFICEAAV